MGRHVTHGPCPKCGSRDNLATYADGHQWCFGGCGYYVPAPDTLKSRVEKRYENSNDVRVDGCPALPKDASSVLGIQGLRWLKSYGITDDEIRANRILWSDERQQLVFPVYGQDGQGIIMWQARNFDPEAAAKRKYFTSGKPETVLHAIGLQRGGSGSADTPTGPGRSRTVVLTEDLLSSIKVGRHVPATPLWGSNISDSRLNQLRSYFDKVVVWLDYDKRIVARNAFKAVQRLGMEFAVIVTEKDPKELSDAEILEELEKVK